MASVFLAASTLVVGAEEAAPTGPRPVFPYTAYEFSPVVEGAEVIHAFPVRNLGDAPLEILNLRSG
jgi:hypothetical protein